MPHHVSVNANSHPLSLDRKELPLYLLIQHSLWVSAFHSAIVP